MCALLVCGLSHYSRYILAASQDARRKQEVSYVQAPTITAADLADLFRASGIRRPVDDLPRLQKMLEHANLTIAAYLDGRLVGIARALTDFSFCCYLSD